MCIGRISPILLRDSQTGPGKRFALLYNDLRVSRSQRDLSRQNSLEVRGGTAIVRLWAVNRKLLQISEFDEHNSRSQPRRQGLAFHSSVDQWQRKDCFLVLTESTRARGLYVPMETASCLLMGTEVGKMTLFFLFLFWKNTKKIMIRIQTVNHVTQWDWYLYLWETCNNLDWIV